MYEGSIWKVDSDFILMMSVVRVIQFIGHRIGIISYLPGGILSYIVEILKRNHKKTCHKRDLNLRQGTVATTWPFNIVCEITLVDAAKILWKYSNFDHDRWVEVAEVGLLQRAVG